MNWRRTEPRRVLGWALLCLALGSPLLATDYEFTKIRVPGSTSTSARGINARGDIVGHYGGADGATHAFLLREDVFTKFDFPGAQRTSAKGINARGDIVGDFDDEEGGTHAYLLSEGQFTRLDHPGASGTFGFGINNAGDITGLGIDLDGFLLKDGVWRKVRDSGGVFGAQDNGNVLVGAGAVIRLRPRRYQVVEYPGPEPVDFTVLRWINQRGDVVGVTGTGDDPSSWFGFVLRDGQYTRIAVDFPGATGTRALAINDDGVIVGDYITGQGNERGFMAVPLEAPDAD